jgi:hypothetical protein
VEEALELAPKNKSQKETLLDIGQFPKFAFNDHDGANVSPTAVTHTTPRAIERA